jgi:hypothetical protein
MHRADTHRRCPACGAVVDRDALAVSDSSYACPSCWTRQKPEGELEQPVRLMGQDPAWDEPPEVPETRSDTTVGAELYAARRTRGVTLDQASAATRIPVRYLAALEDDAPLSEFPARTYARSFLREYARAVGLDDDRVVRRFDEDHGFGPAPLSVVPVVPPKQPSRRRSVLVSLLAVAALIAILVSFQPWTSSSPSVLPSVATQVPVAERTGDDRPDETRGSGQSEEGRDDAQGGGFRGVLAEIRVLEPTWVQARADGTQLVARTLPAGRSITLRAKDQLDLLLGNAEGVRLRVGGERVPLQADGAVVELSLGWNGSRVTGLEP